MKSVKQNNKAGHITEGDVFDDLGFSPEETLEAKIKSDILHAIILHAKREGYRQAQLASLLKVHQPDVSNLLKGKISKFSITRLIQFAGRLNLDAHIEVASRRKIEPLPSLAVSTPKAAKRAMARA